jgi:hypothetical protein
MLDKHGAGLELQPRLAPGEQAGMPRRCRFNHTLDRTPHHSLALVKRGPTARQCVHSSHLSIWWNRNRQREVLGPVAFNNGPKRGDVIPFGPTAYTIRVALRDVEPEVWRRIVVPSETPCRSSLGSWSRRWAEGYHLHMFDVGGILFGEPDEDADYVINERGVTVRHVLPRVGAGLR